MKPDMEGIKKRIAESRDFLDDITAKVPGFTGYVEKAEMYDADRVIRGFLAERLLSFKKVIDAAMRDFQRKGEALHLADLDSLGIIVERAVKKCQYAEYGISAAKMKIKPEDQNRLLEYDFSLLSNLDELGQAFGRFSGGGDLNVPDTIAEIRKKIEEFEKAFEERKLVTMEVF